MNIDQLKSAFEQGLISEEMFQRALPSLQPLDPMVEPEPVTQTVDPMMSVPEPAPMPAPMSAPLPAPTLMPSEPSSITQGIEPVTPVIESAPAPAPAAERYRQSIEDMANIQAKAAEEQAVLKEQAIAEEQRLVAQEQEELAKRQEEIQASEARIESNINSLRNMKPETFWGSKSDSDRMMSGIALALGALGSTIAGGPNTAMQIINGQMQDFKAKEDAKFNKTKELINLSRLSLADKQKALTAAQETWASRSLGAAKVLEKQLDLVASKAKSPQILERAEQIKAELDLKQEATAQEVIAEFQKTMTPGQKKVDEEYAKDYNKLTGKGLNNAEAAITKLEELATEMENDSSGLSFIEDGGTQLPIPDMLRSKDAIRRRSQTRNAANTTLKELFGGQLSDAEREAAAEEYYNDSLGNEDNAKILRAKIADLKRNRDTEIAKAKYYEQHGTLKGYTGTKPPSPVVPVPTKTINGKTYQKVPGGWQEVK